MQGTTSCKHFLVTKDRTKAYSRNEEADGLAPTPRCPFNAINGAPRRGGWFAYRLVVLFLEHFCRRPASPNRSCSVRVTRTQTMTPRPCARPSQDLPRIPRLISLDWAENSPCRSRSPVSAWLSLRFRYMLLRGVCLMRGTHGYPLTYCSRWWR